MPITLKDIARLAKVSTATVSRVLNDNAEGNMSAETYKRIKKIIDETGYTPHALASGLRRGLSNVIGLILPDNVNPYYSQLGKSIENECFNNGYMTLICNTNSDKRREIDYLRHLIGQRVTGILFCSTGLIGEKIKSIVPAQIKVILLDEEIPNFESDIIIGDDYKGGHEGARYLFNLGHRKILVITGPESRGSSRNRLKGYLDFLKENNMKIEQDLIIEGQYDIESAYNIVINAMEKRLSFSAVFTFNDMMAIGSIKAFNKLNLRVPQDVSVLGYDNIFIDDLITPRISTIATPLEELGRIAVNRLLSSIKKVKEKSQKILLEPMLVVRESCERFRNL